MDEQALERLQFLAERANVVGQMCTVFNDDGDDTSLVAPDGAILASGMAWEDGAFYAEARNAVVALVKEALLRRAYADYVRSVVQTASAFGSQVQQAVLPMTFEEWLRYEEKERER